MSVSELRAKFASNARISEVKSPTKKKKKKKRKVYGAMAGGPPMMGMGPPKPLWEIMFDKFDEDSSGAIDKTEFQMLTRNLGYAVAEAELEIALKLLSAGNSSGIVKKKFKVWWKSESRWQQIQISDDDLKHRQDAAELFSKYDADNGGTLDAQEFKLFYPELKAKGLTTLSAAEALQDLDSSGDGEVDYSEYVEWLARIGSIRVATFMTTTGAAPGRQ